MESSYSYGEEKVSSTNGNKRTGKSHVKRMKQ